jgi:hypothetical protein
MSSSVPYVVIEGRPAGWLSNAPLAIFIANYWGNLVLYWTWRNPIIKITIPKISYLLYCNYFFRPLPEDAALANDAAPESFAERIRDAIEIHRLRRRRKMADGDGEERMNAAAAMDVLDDHYVPAKIRRPLTKGE